MVEQAKSMKPRFNVLNEQPSSAELLRGPSSQGAPPVAPLGSDEAAAAVVDPATVPEPDLPPAGAAEGILGGGMFDGRGPDYVALRGDPPDVGHKTRQLLWDRGITVPQAPPATLDRFCCLTGPCRHYSEIHVDEPDTLPEQRVKVLRLCRRHLDDDGGTLELSEGTVPACMSYEPPWWSIDGWRMKVLVAYRLSRTLVRISRVDDSAVWRRLVDWGVLPASALEDPNYGIK